MKRRNRFNRLLGIFLLALGAWFLAKQLYPELFTWVDIPITWAWFVIGTGIFLFVLGLLLGAPGMAVPATIVGGIGVLLYWQDMTGNWESWSYAWTLIPGFVGLGIILAGLLEGNFRSSLYGGGTLIVISLVLFVIFSSLMGGPYFFGPYWPVLLILLGLWMLLRVLLRPRKKQVE